VKAPLLNSHGAILLAGFVLAAIGLAYAPPQSQGNNQGQGQGITITPPSPPVLPALGNANSNNTMIAVTGIDLTGSSVLFLIDTVNRQLAVYQAMGGSESTQGVRLVAARRIDLDLQLYGLNDKSEYSFEDLQKRMAERKSPSTPVK
jgi:hypothetical protein